MDDQIIRAYLWQDVSRLGFCPRTEKDQNSWLHQYHRSLKEFWEIDCYPDVPRKKGGTIEAFLDCGNMLALCLEYTVKSSALFVVHFRYSPPLNSKELMWDHDVDGNFFTFPASRFLNHHNKRLTAAKQFSKKDITIVIDGLLLHPAAHQHIKSPINDHEIRIGGGIDNPFLYLFHLRYQLCPIKKKKEDERARLIDLFSNAIRSDSLISANDLLAQP